MTVSQGDGFRFLVLNTKAGWDEGLPVALQTSDAGIALQEFVTYTTERTIDFAALPPGLDITDIAVGQCYVIYILDAASRSVWIYEVTQARFERIACLEAFFSHPTVMAFAPGTLFVADDQAEQRLFAFAVMNWQMRWTVGTAHDAVGTRLDLEQPFTPIDLTLDDDANLYALDRTNLAIVKFDQGGRLITRFGHEAMVDSKPLAITFSGDKFLYVLDGAGQKVLQFTPEGELVNGDFITLDTLPFEIEPSDLAVDKQGQLYIGDGRTIPEDEEDDRFIPTFSPSGEFIDTLSAYRGAVTKLVADNTGRIYILNEEEGKIVILQLARTFLPPGGTPPPIGYYFSRAFDSTTPETQWHKLVLEGEIPANTQVLISCLMADEKKFLLDGVEDLDDFLANEAIAPQDKVGPLNTLAWSMPLVNPRDALIRSPEGRYLWLRVQLVGREQVTPRVQSIRAYFPRMSYLRYLPAVYQEDTRSRDFLERFLSLFETFFTQLEWQIEHIVRYFDADVVVGDFLRWLASWLAIAADENWPEDQLRILVQKAPELFKKRGTREGLEATIALFTGEKPFIVEQFQLRCAKVAEIQQLLAQLYGADPYCFCVLLKPFQIKNEAERQTIRRLIDAEKPAHTCAGLLVLQPWMYLDMHTYLEVNTYLSMPSPRLDVGAALSRDTILTDVESAGQIERRARVGFDTILT